jgi:hypothetical protein
MGLSSTSTNFLEYMWSRSAEIRFKCCIRPRHSAAGWGPSCMSVVAWVNQLFCSVYVSSTVDWSSFRNPRLWSSPTDNKLVYRSIRFKERVAVMWSERLRTDCSIAAWDCLFLPLLYLATEHSSFIKVFWTSGLRCYGRTAGNYLLPRRLLGLLILDSTGKNGPWNGLPCCICLIMPPQCLWSLCDGRNLIRADGLHIHISSSFPSRGSILGCFRIISSHSPNSFMESLLGKSLLAVTRRPELETCLFPRSFNLASCRIGIHPSIRFSQLKSAMSKHSIR